MGHHINDCYKKYLNKLLQQLCLDETLLQTPSLKDIQLNIKKRNTITLRNWIPQTLYFLSDGHISNLHWISIPRFLMVKWFFFQ